MWNALTGGWWEVCSVRYEIRRGLLSGVVLPCCGTDRETAEAFLSALADLKLDELLPAALPRAVVLILGALSSVSQLH